MATPDNRIRLTPTLIDFDEIGTTGKAHDEFPKPGPARFDHMRSFLIGLLANQASFQEPIEFRIGSLWFDLNSQAFKVRNDPGALLDVDGDAWVGLANAIELESGLSLAQWFSQIRDLVVEADPNLSTTFSRLTRATAGEAISAGSLVYPSSDGVVAKADATMPAKTSVIGLSTLTIDTGAQTVIQHVGLARMRLLPGLTVTAGDSVFLATDGRGTTIEPASSPVKVGIIFNALNYDSGADDPSALVVVTTGGSVSTQQLTSIIEQTFSAGETIQAGRAVRISANNSVIKALATSFDGSMVIGIAESTISSGGSGAITTHPGSLIESAQLVTGLTVAANDKLWLSAVEAGKMTNVAPTTIGQIAKPIGLVRDASSYVGTTEANSKVYMVYQPEGSLLIG